MMEDPVDAAFERLFGYPWGTTFDGGRRTAGVGTGKAEYKNPLEEIFGPIRAARIMRLRLPSLSSGDDPRHATNRKRPRDNQGDDDDGRDEDNDTFYYRHPLVTVSHPGGSASTSTATNKDSTMIQSGGQLMLSGPTTTSRRRRVILEEDYKSIELPQSVAGGSNDDVAVPAAALAAPDDAPVATATAASSNLDIVLQQLAGTKRPNTVEKTSDDWEAFKGENRTLQDELERRAQSKDAFLVRQDFLGRVDQRTFELEKEERDRERARRATSSSTSAGPAK